MFEGITGTSYTGDIAIDDVEILDGACPLPGGWINKLVCLHLLLLFQPSSFDAGNLETVLFPLSIINAMRTTNIS